MRRFLKIVAIVCGVLIALVIGLKIALSHDRPTGGEGGAAADELGHTVERAVDLAAWQRTGALRWTMGGRQHLWDKKRMLARVRWGGREALLNLTSKDGLALVDGRRVEGAAARAVLDKGYRLWINDSFWLNPLVKLFDDGVTRTRFTVDGHAALEVAYAAGGVTPGDRYLWLLGDDGTPRAWRVWASILPVKGIEFSWEGWIQLATGARVATMHHALGLAAVHLTDVAGGASLADIAPDGDPFAAL